MHTVTFYGRLLFSYAIRKGRTYATVIYGMADYYMIALLEGRESEALKE